MKLKGSQFFYLFVALVVGSVYYFDYYRGEENKKKEEQDSILVPIPKQDVTRIELQNASGRIEISRAETGWKVTAPIPDMGAVDEIDGWVQSLTTEKSLEKIGEGESFEWSTYGLDQPVSTLWVESRDKRKIKLQLSSKKNFEGNLFLRKDEDKMVYVVSTLWTSLLEKTVQDLRDKRLLRSPLSTLSGFVLKQKTGELAVSLKNGKWESLLKPSWTLDQNKVREFVNVVQEMRATGFVLEQDPLAKDLLMYRFGGAGLSVKYLLNDGKHIVIEFGQDKDKTWYAWPKELRRVVKVDPASVEKLLKVTLGDLRDRELPFIFNKDDVKVLAVSDSKNFELRREGDEWKSSSVGKVEGVEVNQLLENIRQLRVAEFLDGRTTAPGLERAPKKFTLADLQGKNFLELSVGESFKKKEDKIEKTFFYVKSSLYPDVFALKEDDVKTLSTERLFKAQSESTDQKTNTIENRDGQTPQKANEQ